MDQGLNWALLFALGTPIPADPAVIHAHCLKWLQIMSRLLCLADFRLLWPPLPSLLHPRPACLLSFLGPCGRADRELQGTGRLPGNSENGTQANQVPWNDQADFSASEHQFFICKMEL